MLKQFKFNFIAFMVAFGIGILYVYVKAPAPKIVIKYPTPYNAGSVVYKDSADTCFTFSSSRVECTKSAKKQPVQVVEEDNAN
jgi:hypothetical protein